MEKIKGEIKTITESSGVNKSKKPWKRYLFELEEGVKIATFDDKIGTKYKPGMIVEIDREMGGSGFWELKAMREVDNTTQTALKSPQVEKVLKEKKLSRDGSYVTAGEIIKEAVKLWTSERKVEGTWSECVEDVMTEYKRVREEFK